MSRQVLCRVFQFQYGTIKRPMPNPCPLQPVFFQFQYGTIKSYHGASLKLYLPAFQFQYGTIKRL